MTSFLQGLSEKPLTSLDKKFLVSSEASREILSRSSDRLFELGCYEVDREIEESQEKALKRAKIYKVVRIIVSLIGVALICIFPISLIFNIPIWVPIVVSLLGGITTGFIANKLKSKEQLIKLRHKSLLTYRQSLAKKRLSQKSFKEKIKEHPVNQGELLSERMRYIYKEFGVETSSEGSCLSDISYLNPEAPIFLHRYESGTISKDTQSLLNIWKNYQTEVIKLKRKETSSLKLEESLLSLKNKFYEVSGIKENQLPIPNIGDTIRELKSFCSYGLQVSNLLQDSLTKYENSFLLLPLIEKTKLGLGCELKSKKEELSLLMAQTNFYLKKLSQINKEEEVFCVVEEMSSLELIPRLRSIISSSSLLNSNILSKILSHPTNRIQSYKERLVSLKLDLQDPHWASDWFESSDHVSWKDSLLSFCSFTHKKKKTREDVREKLLIYVTEKEVLLKAIEDKWNTFLNNDFAKLVLDSSCDKYFKVLEGLKNPLDKEKLSSIFHEMQDLKSIFLDEMIGADDENAVSEIMTMVKDLEDFNSLHLFPIEKLVANYGEHSIKAILNILTTKNSTFRKRQKKSIESYKKSLQVSGSIQSLYKGLKDSSRSQLVIFKELLNQFEQTQSLLLEPSVSNQEKLVKVSQDIHNTCSKFSIDEINSLKSYLSTFSEKLSLISLLENKSQNKKFFTLDDLELEAELNALEKQVKLERNQINSFRKKNRTILENILRNIENQVVNLYKVHASVNIALSTVFFLIMIILGATLLSLNVWWIHLIFFSVLLSFLGINFLFSHIANKKAEKKIELDLQKMLLISSEIKHSNYPNPDLERLRELQGSLGLDGVHPTWANKEFLSDSKIASYLIMKSNKEEVVKKLKSWSKEIQKKGISSDNHPPQIVHKENEDQIKDKKLEDLYFEHNLIEKNLISKEQQLDEIIHGKIVKEQELSILEKEDLKLKTLVSDIEKTQEDVASKKILIDRLQLKYKFLTNILVKKSNSVTEEQKSKANSLFNDLLEIYKDKQLSKEDKKEKSKAILKLIYKDDLFVLIQSLIDQKFIQCKRELSISKTEQLEKDWRTKLNNFISLKIDYLKDLVKNLETIESSKDLNLDRSKITEITKASVFLIEEMPSFLRNLEMISIPSSACSKLEQAKLVSLKFEEICRELNQEEAVRTLESLETLQSIFSSLLRKLLQKNSDKIEQSCGKLEEYISLIIQDSTKSLEKKEEMLINMFSGFSLAILKDIRRKVLIEISRLGDSISSFEKKVSKLAYLKQCLSKGKKEKVPVEEHRKIIKQKKEKDILSSKKLVKLKLQELDNLKRRKLLKEKEIEELKGSLFIQKESELSHPIKKTDTSVGQLEDHYSSLLKSMILSRKEITKFSQLYKNWVDKDPIYADHMKKMHKKAKEAYQASYYSLIKGVSDSSIKVPQNLNEIVIKRICQEILDNQNKLENLSEKINDLLLKEDKLLIIQKDLHYKRQKVSYYEEKLSTLETVSEVLEKISSLNSEISILEEQETALKAEISQLSALTNLRQECLKVIQKLKEEFFNEQQKA